MPFSLSNSSTIFHHNETSIGYSLDCGSSYVLPRMKGELGSYLALTGKKIYGNDLTTLGITYNSFLSDYRLKPTLNKLH